MLDENHHLIQCIMDYQSKGKTAECTQYQQILHRNLVYLATIADSNQNMQSLLPAPPTQNINLGPGGMSQTGPSQTLHTQGNLSDALGASLPPSSLMPNQISNGPTHVSMQQSGQATMPATSMSMAVSSHGTAPGYSHAVSSSQNLPMQTQGTIGNYVSRANMNLPSNPVSMMHQQAASSHYTTAQGGGQHYQGQSSISIMSQSNQGSSMMGQRPLGPYRPSQQGHSEYAYQQSTYGEQSYDRTFDDSSQHYYEGGNAQYSQQQSGYQQGAGQQQAYSQQQQYSNQQNYPGQQQQGYVPAQGTSSQYSTYQQGQTQPYSSYRAPQTASSAQQQRPYGYGEGQYANYQQ